MLEYAAPVWDCLPCYLTNDLERIQKKSQRIIGLPSDTLPSPRGRRKKVTLREIETIISNTNHQCQALIPVVHKHDHYTRFKENSDNVGKTTSRTETPKLSLIPWAIELIKGKIF